MNHNHLIKICAGFNLEKPIGSPTRVYGGLLHSMWKVDTNKASYAIKQISKDIDLTNDQIIQNYHLTEEISSRFKELDIPAIHAINKLTIIDGVGFLVYPWVDAKSALKPSESQALKIATILAKIHLIDLKVPGIIESEFTVYNNTAIVELIEKAKSCNYPFASDLKLNLNNLLAANDAYQNAIALLKNHTIISHGDLDQKNVLWDQQSNPILIDWESACKIKPTYDLVNIAFYWSGIVDDFNQELFLKILQTYKNSGGVINKDHLEAAFYATLSWINWLAYNIKRACNSSDLELKKLSEEQVSQTLATILKLQKIIPELIKIL